MNNQPPLTLAIAPDVSPTVLPVWYLFANYLQKKMQRIIRSRDFFDFADQQRAIDNNEIDIIFANPFNSCSLMQKYQYIPIAKEVDAAEEMVIVCKKDTIEHIEDLQENTNIAAADNPDIRQLGLILLEPAALNQNNTHFITTDNHLLAVKKILNNSAQIAFLPKTIYEKLSKPVQNDLHLLVANQKEDIDALTHIFLVHPSQATIVPELTDLLIKMNSDSAGKSLLEEMNVSQWKPIQDKGEVDFLIDLVETLQI